MSIVPQGEKARTFDPHHPSWSSNNAQQDSANERNYMGLLVQKGRKRSNTQLVVLCGGDDAGEQSGHRCLRWMIQELNSGSPLASRLLRRFAFLFIPMVAQQGVRDGFNRFPYDCPAPGLDAQNQPYGGSTNVDANGYSEVGVRIINRAVYNWVYDPADTHATPSASVFCIGTFHCDVPNMLINRNEGGNAAFPTAPYGYLEFPGHQSDPDGGVPEFRSLANGGFDSVIWPEFYWPEDNIAKGGGALTDLSAYGATEFYFELPWRNPGHKASYWYEDEVNENFAQAFLAGLATIATGWNFDGDATPVTAAASIATPAGHKSARGSAPNISATSNIAAAPGRKAVRSTSALTGVGALTHTGVHAGNATTTVSATASAALTAKKGASGTGAELSAAGSMVVVGLASQQEAGSAAISAAGTISVTGSPGRSGAAAAVGGVAAATFSGTKSVPSIYAGAALPVSGVAAGAASGQRQHARTSTLSGAGAAAATGTKDVSGAAATVTGVGRCVARGPALATTGGFYFQRYIVRRSR